MYISKCVKGTFQPQAVAVHCFEVADGGWCDSGGGGVENRNII
jgi:hypothetical protein